MKTHSSSSSSLGFTPTYHRSSFPYSLPATPTTKRYFFIASDGDGDGDGDGAGAGGEGSAHGNPLLLMNGTNKGGGLN